MAGTVVDYYDGLETFVPDNVNYLFLMVHRGKTELLPRVACVVKMPDEVVQTFSQEQIDEGVNSGEVLIINGEYYGVRGNEQDEPVKPLLVSKTNDHALLAFDAGHLTLPDSMQDMYGDFVDILVMDDGDYYVYSLDLTFEPTDSAEDPVFE